MPGQFKQKGYSPNLPILILPGLCSSCLKVVESPYKEWNDRRIWLDITTIGFGKVWDALRIKKKRKEKKVATSPVVPRSNEGMSIRSFDVYSSELRTVMKEIQEEDEQPVIPIDLDQGEKRRWIGHMVLQADGITDPPGIKLRPLEGIRGVMYLDPGAITNSLSYVFGPLVETFWEIGYTDDNIRASPYDWRVPPFRLEERDQYFTKLQEMIEDMVKINKKKVVILAHSLGTRLTHYFLRRANDVKGRQWISDHIHTWVAIGPLFLGAAKSVRAITSGERMGLESFLFEQEGLDLSRLCGSSAWMFPYHTGDYDFENFVYKTNPATGKWQSQSIKDTLIESKVPHLWDNYVKYYHQDPYFGTQEDQLKAPPVDKLFAIYGINLRTEAFYFYKKSKDGISVLELDSKGEFPNYECSGGIAFETCETRQNCINGKKRGGDGTVSYASLSYCKNWEDDINVIIEELEGAEHREILKDKTFTAIVVEYCSTAPPPPELPETFRELRYDVQEIRGNKQASRVLVLERKYIRITKPNGETTFKKKYPRIISVQSAQDDIFFLEIQSVGSLYFRSEKFREIPQELMVRLKFIEYSRFRADEQRDEMGQTELHRAVLDNDIALVRELISDDRDVNAQDRNDWTPLHCAMYKRYLDIAMILLKEKKINTTLLTKDGTSALHYLVRPGSDDEPLEEVLDRLVSTGLSINIKARFGATPIHHAAMYGSVRATKWLLQKFANVNAVTDSGETPLHIAILQNHKELVELLLTNGADKHIVNQKGKTPIACAQMVSQELYTFVRDFQIPGMRARAMFAYQGLGPQELSFKEGDRLNKIEINNNYGFGWWFGECNGATGYFPSNYVKISDPPQDLNRPPLGSKEPEDSAVDVRDEYGQTPLHKACYENRLEEVLQLLVDKANVNAVDRNGWTPFHCAANKGNLDAVLMLLEQRQLKYSLRSSDGTTAFHYLVRNIAGPADQFKLQKVLEKCITAGGVDVDVLAKNGETPLHQAVMRNNEFTVKFLLENGANVNAVDDRNTTPLFYAVGQNSVSIVAVLLRNGANPSIKGKRGSPLDLAKEQKNPNILNLLSRYRAEEGDNEVEIAPPSVPPRKNSMAPRMGVINRPPVPQRPAQFQLRRSGAQDLANVKMSIRRPAPKKPTVEDDFVEFTPVQPPVPESPFSVLLKSEFQSNISSMEEQFLKFMLEKKYNNDVKEFMKTINHIFPESVTPITTNNNNSVTSTLSSEPEKKKKNIFGKKKDKK